MKKQLLSELCRKTLLSCGIFAALFACLWLVEYFVPSMAGRLLPWSPAFIVGIPASILGVAYVLTITNPKNYIGFYVGVTMSILLGVKFWLAGQYDLVFLYICLFIPFQVMSLVKWRKNTLHPSGEAGELRPKYLSVKAFIIEMAVAAAIVVADYFYCVHLLHLDMPLAAVICAGITIASSFFANLLLIYQTNDAWMWWVVYSISSLVLFCILFDPFMIVLNVAFLVVNGSAHIAWIKMTRPEDMGWATCLFARKK